MKMIEQYFTTKSSTDFSSGSADIDIGDTTIASAMAQE
jgi:hypothetical protein